ncbi:hypothetical protein L0152_33500 [bacterium]|nr:hypothetical protein [bacterium]
MEVYFQLKNKPAYSMRVEAKSGSSDFECKGAKFEVHYFARHEITSSDTREVEAIRDLELLFAAANHRSVEYISGLLKKAGLKWTAGWKNNITYEGTVSIAGQQASVRVDVREVPDDARFPKRKYAEISMRVFPEFRPAPEEKKQSAPANNYGPMPLFQPAAVKP